jgi:hypothetical protein
VAFDTANFTSLVKKYHHENLINYVIRCVFPYLLMVKILVNQPIDICGHMIGQRVKVANFECVVDFHE